MNGWGGFWVMLGLAAVGEGLWRIAMSVSEAC